MYAIVAPGQGSQAVGMLAGWLRDPQRAELVRQWSEAADRDLAHLGTRASAAEIERTENTQPLLVAQGLLTTELADDLPDGAAVLAGHSIGELTVAVYAGVLTAADAVGLAAIRGRAMAAACAAAPTSMSAVIGGEQEPVLERLAELGLSPATFNGPGQIVAAGTVEQLAELAAAPPTGTTVRPLAVAGAFHTHHMEAAQQTFALAAAGVEFRDPRHVLLSNTDGAALTTGAQVRARLIRQIVSPVRWDLCVAGLAAHEPAVTVALPPAKTLKNLLRRSGLSALAVTTDRDLATALAKLAAPVTGGLIRAGA